MAKLYTEAELKKMKIAELRTLADEAGYETEGEPKANLIEALLEVEADDEVDDSGVPDDLDDEADDEVEEDDDLEEDDLELDDEVVTPAEEKRQADRRARMDKAEAGMRDNDKPAGEKKTRVKRTAEPKVDANGKATLPAKQVATYLKTEAKTLRQFLRSDASTFEAVGSGGRYEFSEDDLPKIKTEFDAWKSAHASRGSRRGKAAEAAEPIDTVDEIEEIEELEIDDDEISDDDLEEDDLELDE